MYLSKKHDNKTKDKHTVREQPAQYMVPRTRPRVASGSLFHHQCVTKLPLCRHLRSGKEHLSYSARCLQIRRDGKALHGACNVAGLSLRVVEQWVR